MNYKKVVLTKGVTLITLQNKADGHIEILEKKIGQLVIENDFLKKKCEKLPFKIALK